MPIYELSASWWVGAAVMASFVIFRPEGVFFFFFFFFFIATPIRPYQTQYRTSLAYQSRRRSEAPKKCALPLLPPLLQAISIAGDEDKLGRKGGLLQAQQE